MIFRKLFHAKLFLIQHYIIPRPLGDCMIVQSYHNYVHRVDERVHHDNTAYIKREKKIEAP